MGVVSSKFPFRSKKNVKILMLGLDGAGKTTLLYRLLLNEVVSTISTLGYNVETLHHKNLNLTVWDLAGQDSIRGLWKQMKFYYKCNAIIFVVDSSDRSRINEAANELSRLLSEEELKSCPLLVFGTKQDCDSPMDVPELTDSLGLHDVKDRKWYIQPTMTFEGIGIYEGLDWLANSIQTERKTLKEQNNQHSIKHKFLNTINNNQTNNNKQTVST
ncbi:ADP-ribosylation factor-related protein [Heterostelium album PN500]|uniref:ADP-ribosylation factor-related protein n=1 Tax=Heterostelium pallidum (strain ATCC 26659 / Pp 5 / PN500) TaxID=670386 RepID=D3AYS8_HETP5|nr:ADP-ribosylation factor-related protein [Heterostelium album PN500]EFA85618.1 ADP-ribosylation factor-related protein [Heterostelium album PN500]|eukprot:XP_020437725.1 ADP-ribosylation factor-related protein [Heterostelium album PN500]